MNSFNFYARKEKFLRHSGEYGTGYYKKLDNYYGPGNARYFYSEDEWYAYLRDSNKLLEKAKDDVRKQNEAKEKAYENVYKAAQGRDAAIKNSGQTSTVQPQKKWLSEEEQKEQKETKDKINKALDEADADTAIETASNSKEAQEFIKHAKEVLKGVDTREELNKRWWTLEETFFEMMKPYIDDLPDDCVWIGHMIEYEVREKAIEEAKKSVLANKKIDEIHNERYQMEQQNMYTTAVQNKDLIAVSNVVNKKVDDFYSKKVHTAEDVEELDNYLSDLRSCELKFEDTSPFPLKLREGGKVVDLESDLQYINYRRENDFEEEDDYDDGGGNCRLCSLAMDLRRRGYDVTAASANDIEGNSYATWGEGMWALKLPWNPNGLMEGKLGNNNVGIGEFYKDANKADIYASLDVKNANIEKSMSKYKNTYGIMNVSWEGVSYGHAVYYEVNDSGELFIYDGQINKKQTWNDYKDIVGNSVVFVRTDNLTPDYDNLVKKGYVVYN